MWRVSMCTLPLFAGKCYLREWPVGCLLLHLRVGAHPEAETGPNTVKHTDHGGGQSWAKAILQARDVVPPLSRVFRVCYWVYPACVCGRDGGRAYPAALKHRVVCLTTCLLCVREVSTR